MRILALILFSIPTSVYAASKLPSYTPECIAWGSQVDAYLPLTKTQNLDQAIAKADPVLGLLLLKSYPGESLRNPQLFSDSTGSNQEKLKQWYFYPSCPLLKYFDVGKALIQAKLTRTQETEFRTRLFVNLARDEKNQASFITLVIYQSLVDQALDHHKITLNEAEEFEWQRISLEVVRLQEGQHDEQTKLCSHLSYCWPWSEPESVRYYSMLYSEIRHIRSEMSFWARHVDSQ